jgi:hypothetical protein
MAGNSTNEICHPLYRDYLPLDPLANFGRITCSVTQADIDKVIQEAKRQGVPLTQVTIFYGGTGLGTSEMGSFSPDGIPLASDGSPLSLDKITGFYSLAAD